MITKRIIPCLDVKDGRVVKGVNFQRLGAVASPVELARYYSANGAVDFDDRRILNQMHKSYHDGLGGNGDLDNIMSEVNRLPLKK